MTIRSYLPSPSTVLPSFAADYLASRRGSTSTSGSRRQRKLHSTSYLDGLRGLAAASVFAYHYTDYNHKMFLPAFGNNPPEIGSSLLQLPFIRVLYAGTPMVHVFFVISGFALAYRPLKALHAGQHGHHPAGGREKAIAKCQNIVASSAIRRPFRLFGPPLALTLIDAFIVQFGLMQNFLKRKDNIVLQLREWAGDAINAVTWPWGWDTGPHSRYNPHLWTIPIEFIHSMLLFLVLLVAARLRTALMRKGLFVAIMFYCIIVCGRWAAFEFISGALLADFHLDRELREFDTQIEMHDDGEKQHPFYNATHKSAIHIFTNTALLIFSGFIISWPPRKDDVTPTFAFLHNTFAPQAYTQEKHEHGKDFWFALAALALVHSVGQLKPLKRLLESPVPQYAGRISFAFYILQHPILNIFEHPVLGAAYKPPTEDQPAQPGWGVRGLCGQSDPLQRTLAWVLGLVILGGLLVWPADIFTRAVDAPCVKFARKVESAVYVEEEECNGILPVRNS